MSDFEFEVIGDAEVNVRLGADVRRVLDSVREFFRKVGFRHEAIVKTEKLSGQVLHRRSGRLSAGVHSELIETENVIGTTTGIGPDLLYGKMHEEGGVFQVPAHRRMVSKAWGRPITPREVMVKSHAMHVPKRSFLRSMIKEQAPRDFAELQQTVQEALRK